MGDYRGIKGALENEKELIRMMQSMPEKDLDRLMNASSAYAAAMQAKAKADEEQQRTEQKKLEMEYKLKQEEEATKRHEATLKAQEEMLRVKSDEFRKNEEKRADEAKRIEEQRTKAEKERLEHKLLREREELTARTKAKLEAKREFDRMDTERIRREEEQARLKHKLAQEEKDKDFERQKSLIAHKMKEKAKLKVEMADFLMAQKIKEHKEFFADETSREVALAEVRSRTELQTEQLKLRMREQFFSGPEGRERLRNILGVGVGLVGAYYAFKVAAPLFSRALKNYFFKPQLVNKSRKYSPLRHTFNRMIGAKDVPDVILPPVLQQRMDRVIEGTRNTSTRGGLFGHMLLYGKPGTGKTLFAEKLAQVSHMDFAVMSGPAFDQFKPHEAIVEIRNLFAWANRTRNGLLLFIDECDSFLEDRATLSPERVRVLNEFINQTGTESRKFMLVFETNRPDVLDPAVQSRCTQSIEFIPPTRNEIRLLLSTYVDKYIRKEHEHGRSWLTFWRRKRAINCDALTPEKLDSLAEKFAQHQFVGRDITNCVIALTQAAYASKDFAVTEEIINSVADEQIAKKLHEQQCSESRSQRILDRRSQYAMKM